MAASDQNSPLQAERGKLWQARLNLERRLARLRARAGGQTPGQRFVEVSVALGLRLTGLYGRGKRNAERPELVRRSLTSRAVPPDLAGFTILHLGDFHFEGQRESAERIRDLIAPLAVDLCVYTGDTIFRFNQPYEAVFECAEIVFSAVRAKHGIYGCMGNNDYADFVDPMAKLGLHWLINEHVVVEHNGVPITIAGVDDPHKFRTADIDLALAGAPEPAFTLLLAHAPELAKRASAKGVDVYLCGHTHGGQLCLPWIGPVYKNGNCRRDQVKGIWREGSMVGHTTAGLGCTAVPVRYNCPPEAVVLELRRQV